VFSAQYEAQIHLLIDCLSQLEGHPVFALKGGTAINLFVTSMPRLSVDIDLTYLPLEPRTEALREIHQEIRGLKEKIEKHVPGARGEILMAQDEVVRRLVISTETSVTKIEPNPVFRGSVYPPIVIDLCAEASEHFQKDVRVKTLDLCSQRLGIEPFDAQELSHLGKESGRLGMNPDYWRKDAKDGTGTCNQAQGAGGRAVNPTGRTGNGSQSEHGQQIPRTGGTNPP